MAQDSGNWTPSTLPTIYQDPALSMTATASNSSSGTVITYTTASAHNLVVGQSVVAYGFGSPWLNYAPNTTINGVATNLGAGKPAVVASVTSSTVFTVNTGTLSTAASSVAGYIQQDALVTNQPWNNTYLSPTITKNQAVGLEWGDSFPIQPNDDRATPAGASNKYSASIASTATSVVADGIKITYKTNAAHGLVAGSWVAIDGIVPTQFNFNSVQVASAADTTTFTVLSPATGTYDKDNSFGVVAPISLNGGSVEAVVTSAVGPIAVSNVSGASSSSVLTFTSVASHGLITGQTVTIAGMVPTAYNVTGVITTTAATTFTIASTANPASSTKSGWASVTSNSYTTNVAHGNIAGQTAVITGASLAEYNVSGTINGTTATILNLPANTLNTAVTSTQPITVSGTAVTYVLSSPHSLTTSDSVSVYGFVGGANLNTRGDVAISAVTSNSVTVNTAADVTSLATSAFAVSGTPGVVTYTSAAHGFKAGQIVTVSGYGGADAGIYNVSSVIISATANAFVVSAGAATAKGTVTGTGTLSVAATTAAKAIAGVTAVAAYDLSSITLTVPNNFVVGQSVAVAGLTGGTAYNTTGTVISADPSQVKIGYAPSVALSGTPAVTSAANAVTVSTNALPIATTTTASDPSKFGFLVKKGGTFVSPAYVGSADNAWGPAYLVPSIGLNPNLDNHEIVANSSGTARLGYPDFYPTYSVPNVVGKTYTNAIQALKAAGLEGAVANQTTPTGITGTTVAATTAVTVSATTNVKIGMPVSGLGIAANTTVAAIPDSTHITLSTPATSANTSAALSFGVAPNTLAISAFATTSSTVTYTVPSVASLSVGDYVNIVYVKDDTNTTFLPNTQYNRNQVAVASIDTANNKFTINQAGVNGANPTGGVVIPLNTVVTAQSPSAGLNSLTEGTNSKLVSLTRNTGL